MRRKNIEVSFFSFQDIVTSLSGVMIIIVLVLSLQLVEQASRTLAKAEAGRGRLVQRVQEARERLKFAQSAALPFEWKEEFMPFIGVSKDMLEDLLSQDRHVLEEEQETLMEVLQQIETQKAMLQENREMAYKVFREQEEFSLERSSDERRYDFLVAEYDRLVEKKDKLRDDLGVTKKKYAFSFVGASTLLPVLVECKGDGTFRAAQYPVEENVVEEFRNLRELCKWLQQFDLRKCYPVLLFRPGSIERSEEIQEAIKKLSPGIRFGREPVAADEEIF